VYGMVVADLSDPKGAADGMVRLVDLYGLGSQQMNLEDQQALFSLGQTLYQKLYQ
jgi:hypothetical protein